MCSIFDKDNVVRDHHIYSFYFPVIGEELNLMTKDNDECDKLLSLLGRKVMLLDVYLFNCPSIVADEGHNVHLRPGLT